MSRLAGRLSYAGDAAPQSNHTNEHRRMSSGSSEHPRGSSGRGGRRVSSSWRQHDRIEDREEVTDRPDYSRPSNRGKPRVSGRGGNQNQGSRGSESSPNERPQRAEQRTERPKNPTRKVEDVLPFEELLDVEDMITQISDLTVRSDRSAAQIKRNILGSRDLLDTMEEEDWQKVCEAMMTTAVDQGEPEFIADLLVALFKHQLFCEIMSNQLMAASSKHVMEADDQPIPAFLAAILCAHWPRQYAKAFDGVNIILFTVVSVIKGWILVLKEDTERYFIEEKKPSYQHMRRGESVEKEDEDTTPKQEEKIIEDPLMVAQCAVAISDLCDTSQKQLWTNWMDVTDEIYECIKPAITHNPNLDGSTKTRLLNTLLRMTQATTRHAPSRKNVVTQTVSTTSSDE